ncbi:hypothetical protein MXB_1736, partial [Myxobolus squamalis]
MEIAIKLKKAGIKKSGEEFQSIVKQYLCNKLFTHLNDIFWNEKTIASFFSEKLLLIQITDFQIEMIYNLTGPIQGLKTLHMIKHVCTKYCACLNPIQTAENNNNLFLLITQLYITSKIKITYSSKKNAIVDVNSFSIQLEPFNDNLVVLCLPDLAHNRFNFDINIYPIETSLDFSFSMNSFQSPSLDYPTICEEKETT